jgi:hypothetical protein
MQVYHHKLINHLKAMSLTYNQIGELSDALFNFIRLQDKFLFDFFKVEAIF